MLQTIIFDAYGTLISTGNGSISAAQTILDRNSSDASAKEFYARWKQLHKAHIQGMTAFHKEEDVFLWDLEQLYSEYHFSRDPATDVQVMLHTLGRRRAFPETNETLEHLNKRYLVCIGSTTDTSPLIRDLENNHITVHHVFTSESLQAYKPQRIFYEEILKQLRINPAEALFVGDSLEDDVFGPQQIGMKTCWINRKDQPLTNATPDFQIKTLSELISMNFEE